MVDPGVDIGHVHLKVADIDRALEFYCAVLGFEVMARMGGQTALTSEREWSRAVWDRPRWQWPRPADGSDGVAMFTAPLDLRACFVKRATNSNEARIN